MLLLFPMLSTGLICDENNDACYNAKGGNIICNETGEEDSFIRALGVYWIEMEIPKDMCEGFGRQG